MTPAGNLCRTLWKTFQVYELVYGKVVFLYPNSFLYRLLLMLFIIYFMIIVYDNL